jgi:hypothetical protein
VALYGPISVNIGRFDDLKPDDAVEVGFLDNGPTYRGHVTGVDDNGDVLVAIPNLPAGTIADDSPVSIGGPLAAGDPNAAR